MTLTQTLKLFDAEEVDFSKAYFQAYLQGKTLHYRNKLLPCYNRIVKGNAPKTQKVTFKDVVDNNYQFCENCSPHFVGPSGWYRVESGILEMEGLRDAYEAAKLFLEASKVGKLTPRKVKNFYDRAVILRAGIYPKTAFAKWVKPRLKSVIEALSIELSGELIENTLKLYSPHPSGGAVQYHYVSFKAVPYQLNMTDALDELPNCRSLYDLHSLMSNLDISSALHGYNLGNGDLLLRRVAIKHFSSPPAQKDCFEVPPGVFRSLPPVMHASATLKKRPTQEMVEIATSLYDPKNSDVSLSEAFKLAETLVK